MVTKRMAQPQIQHCANPLKVKAVPDPMATSIAGFMTNNLGRMAATHAAIPIPVAKPQ